jgi:anti-anti-sigma factor
MDPEAAIERIDPLTAVVTVTGALRHSPLLKDVNTALQQLISDGVIHLVLDLSSCLYVDSAGLGTLLHTYGLISERHGHFRLAGINQRVEDLIVMTHTDALLHRDPDRAASLAVIAAATTDAPNPLPLTPNH